MSKADLSKIPTENLRQELKRRIDLEKANKEKRIQELQETMKKAQIELNQLGATSPKLPKNQNKQKKVPADLNSPPPGIPSVVRATMPKSLKKSIKEESPSPIQKQSAASQNNGDVKRCLNCSATPSNWEFNPRDEKIYCVCGELIMDKDDIHGTSFRD